MQDSQEYKKKKSFFDSVITLYGRNVVLEVLQDENIEVHKLHMSTSNKVDNNIKLINSLAKSRKVEITMHEKNSLSQVLMRLKL